MQPLRAVVAIVLSVGALSGNARAQGVLVRGTDGVVSCVAGGADTHVGTRCGAVTCVAPRVCLDLPGLGARCLDRVHEIPCIPTSLACTDVCPIDSRGADPESCRSIGLSDGRSYALCFYSVELACLGGAPIDVTQCLPSSADSPGVGAGDCDGDGVANASDACLCVLGSSSGGGCPTDAGPEDDAGAPDAASSGDGGPEDASAPVLDASDSMDAEPGAAHVVFRGGGGCTCRASAPDRATRAPGFGCVLAGLVALLTRAQRAAGARRDVARRGA